MVKKDTKSRQTIQVYRYSDGSGYNRASNAPLKNHNIRRKIPYVRHILFLVSLVLIIIFAITYISNTQNSSTSILITNTNISSGKYCKSNIYSKLIIVSINRRHLWACNESSLAYDSTIITGNENLSSDATPIGNYKIYNKLTSQDLIGSNSNTSWNDHVNYWLPFLQNQYGEYGFHDATWRNSNEFGNVSPYTSQASHGCIELPLTTAAWIYNWASIDTNISIIN